MTLVADRLTFAYRDARPVLTDFSLIVEPGERVALVAPSGRGKTTCCRLLGGYLRPQEGAVLVDGVELFPHARRVRATVAPRPVQLIWQHPEQAVDPRMRLWRTLGEGLRAGELLGDRVPPVPEDGTAAGGTVCVPGSPSPAARHRGATAVPAYEQHDDVIERLVASGLLDRLGVRETWLERLPHELSGGELMRCCIARALLARPRYLICDEMTAMLDTVTQAHIWRAVIDIADERMMGLVVVSHAPSLLARIATRSVSL